MKRPYSKKSYRYRIYPTKKQEKTMIAILGECRWLWNHFVEERKTEWENNKKGITCYEQNRTIPKLRERRPSLDLVYGQTRQDVALRVDLAFKSFFRRCRAGENPGYPRFKGWNRYDSFTYPQASSCFEFVEENTKIRLAKIGCMRVNYHRHIEGVLKACIVKRSPTGKWYVSISCMGVPADCLKRSVRKVGIDVGLTTFATFSDGRKIENPRFFKQEEKALARAQRKLRKQEKGTLEREKSRKTVAKIHERIHNRREDFTHQESRKIVNKYGIICVEDLNIVKMIVGNLYSSIRKGIADVAWAEFLRKVTYKAANAGRLFIAVNPAHTSQDCCRCGNRQIMKLSDRVYICPHCGLVMGRDLNAAKNILAVGLHSLANRKVA